MKNFTTQLAFIFLLFFTLASFSIDKKDKKDFLKNSKTSVNDLTLVQRIIGFEIKNSAVVSINTESFLNKSAVTEDSIPNFMIDFDFQENQWSSVYWDWDSLNSEWTPFIQDITYFKNDILVPDSMVMSDYDSLSEDWIATLKEYYYYNATGLDTANITYYFNEESGNWEMETKSSYAYNGDGNLTEETLFIWDPESTTWFPWTKNIYEYNGNLLFSDEYLNVDYFTLGWEPSMKTFYYYDNLNRVENETTYSWDYFEEEYVESSLDKYSYVGNTENIDTAMGFNYNTDDGLYYANWFDKLNYSQTNGMIISDDTYELAGDAINSEMQNTDFVKDYSMVYYYEDNISSVLPKFSMLSTIYPNPSSDQVILQISNPENCRLNVFNINGQLLISKQIQEQITPVNIENLENGIYIFKINNNGKSTSKKIVKQ